MKQLYSLSQISSKAFIASFCFLLLPNALPSAHAINDQDQLILAQATPQTGSANESNPKNIGVYNLEFNRSPIVGNRMRLRGLYSESRLAFTRPRGWDLSKGKVQALIRFQHSPSLYASRSNLTVLVNGTSVGSAPLNRRQSQVGQMLVNIPPRLLQDYNDLTILAQQNNSETCTDPNSPDLWTEILPDSKIIFNFQRQPVPLNFSRYPYPLFDKLGLETNKIAYLQPTQASQSWLTAAGRLQAALGRVADFRPIETNMVADIADVKADERLVIIGTPSEQPLATFKGLPISANSFSILDKNKNPLSEDVGALMMTTTSTGAPVLIVTGNGPKGVAKAAQFLAQPDARKMGTGQVIYVDSVKEALTPGLRQWSRYLPEKNSFKLGEIKTQANGEPFRDVTVRGVGAPPLEIDFRALPDDRFVRGSSMNLIYSYGPQVNPRTSAIQVFLDDNFIGGARLNSESGESRKNLKVDLPADSIKPNSKLKVAFLMNSREVFDKQNCLLPPDQQLTGTIHSDTSFDLKRETSVELPNLELAQFGYPFAAPQDLSKTAIVLPQNPSTTDILTMLAFSERLGRLSQAESVKLDVYTNDSLPEAVRKDDHLVGIGTRDKFPFQQVFQSAGFNLSQAFGRKSNEGSIETLPDTGGMIKQIVSPWSSDRVVLALTAHTPIGLERVRQVISQDPWFFQLKKDTVVINSDKKDPLPYDPDAYQLEFFQTASSKKRVENTNPLSQASFMLQENWWFLPLGIVGVSLLLYGIAQLYLKRMDQ
jgi:hypothetical protein